MENTKIKAVLSSALAACDSRELLDETFSKFDATDKALRIECLNECMGSPKTFFSSGAEISLDDRYESTVQMFLTGAWKLSRAYSGLRG